jgi:hypothetical protein
MSTSREKVKNLDRDRYACNKDIGDTEALAEVRKSNRETFVVLVADAATAGTAVTETVAVRLPTTGGTYRFIEAYMCSPIAVTAHDTNYATISVAKRLSTGASATALASQTTKITGGSGNLTAFAPAALTNTATTADLEIAAASVITVAIAKAASGVALTAATSYFAVAIVVEKT